MMEEKSNQVGNVSVANANKWKRSTKCQPKTILLKKRSNEILVREDTNMSKISQKDKIS